MSLFKTCIAMYSCVYRGASRAPVSASRTLPSRHPCRRHPRPDTTNVRTGAALHTCKRRTRPTIFFFLVRYFRLTTRSHLPPPLPHSCTPRPPTTVVDDWDKQAVQDNHAACAAYVKRMYQKSAQYGILPACVGRVAAFLHNVFTYFGRCSQNTVDDSLSQCGPT